MNRGFSRFRQLSKAVGTSESCPQRFFGFGGKRGRLFTGWLGGRSLACNTALTCITAEAHDATAVATVTASATNTLTKDCVRTVSLRVNQAVIENNDSTAVATYGTAATFANNAPAVAPRSGGSTNT